MYSCVIPPIPCFWSLLPAFSGWLLRFPYPLQAAPAGTAFSLCRTVFQYAPLCRRCQSDLCCISRPIGRCAGRRGLWAVPRILGISLSPGQRPR